MIIKEIKKKAVKKLKNATLYPTFYKVYVTIIHGALFGAALIGKKKMRAIIKFFAKTSIIKLLLSEVSNHFSVCIVQVSLMYLWAVCVGIAYAHLWGDFPSDYFFFDWPSYEEIITALSDLEEPPTPNALPDLEPPTPNEEESYTNMPKDAEEKKPRYNRFILVLSLVVSLAIGVSAASWF